MDVSYLRPSKLMALAYDNTLRQVIGDINIVLEIKSQQFQVILQMIDI